MSSSDLRSVLLETDLTPPRIQRSARYIVSSSDAHDAVMAWRKALNACSESQLLPLLYVANEALQSVARMRGQREHRQKAKELLEAFASILGSGVKEIASRATRNGTGADVVEKVRRTIKIWGDRQVYSARFVGEMLTACEPYRGDHTRSSSNSTNKTGSPIKPITEKWDENSFPNHSGKTLDLKVEVNIKSQHDEKQHIRNDEESDDDDILINDNDILLSTKDSKASLSTHSFGGPKSFKALSTHLSRLSNVKINSSFVSSQSPFDKQEVDTMVGKDLVTMRESIIAAEQMFKVERKKVYEMAQEKYSIESELASYIIWIQEDLENEKQNLIKCEDILQTLKTIEIVHKHVNEKRRRTREIEAEKREKEALERAKQVARQEALERQRHLEEQLKQKEAAPGMVWNQAAGDYQKIHDHTDDSWRDG